jgi:hypothetical protein
MWIHMETTPLKEMGTIQILFLEMNMEFRGINKKWIMTKRKRRTKTKADDLSSTDHH